MTTPLTPPPVILGSPGNLALQFVAVDQYLQNVIHNAFPDCGRYDNLFQARAGAAIFQVREADPAFDTANQAVNALNLSLATRKEKQMAVQAQGQAKILLALESCLTPSKLLQLQSAFLPPATYISSTIVDKYRMFVATFGVVPATTLEQIQLSLTTTPFIYLNSSSIHEYLTAFRQSVQYLARYDIAVPQSTQILHVKNAVQFGAHALTFTRAVHDFDLAYPDITNADRTLAALQVFLVHASDLLSTGTLQAAFSAQAPPAKSRKTIKKCSHPNHCQDSKKYNHTDAECYLQHPHLRPPRVPTAAAT